MTEPTFSVNLDIALRYAHGFGALAPYFSALTRGEALASRCKVCQLTWFAPRLVCTCRNQDMDWHTLPGTGELRSMTTGRALLPATSISGTFTFGLVKMDGADNHCLGRVAAGDCRLQAGQRVRLVKVSRKWAHPSQCCDFEMIATGG